MKSRLFPLTVILGTIAALPSVWADVTLPPIIADHMVLQKSERTAVWGRAEAGEEVSVSLAGAQAKARADAAGRWKVELDLRGVGAGPFPMTIAGRNTITLEDVLVGEVWVASGQSNMDIGVGPTLGAAEEIPRSTNPSLRQFRVEHVWAKTPQEEVQGYWRIAGPETVEGFSGVGYYFGKTLQKELNVPVGLLFAAWGATPSEAWTSAEALDTVPDLKAAREHHWRWTDVYPGERKAYVEKMAAWLKETGREDKATASVAAWAGVDVSAEGWTPITKPCAVSSVGLPEHGVVWLRKEVEIPADVAGKDLFLRVPWNENHLSLFWNGECIREATLENELSPGESIGQTLPGKLVKAGRNVLAIRVYAPADGVTTPGFIVEAPQIGHLPVPDSWLGRAEFSLPPLDAAARASRPAPPKQPLDPSNVAAWLFNGMIHPIKPSTIRGVVWYQGESNAVRAWQYRTAFPLLIADWRAQFRQPDLPFYFCQLAGFMRKKSQPEDSSWAELRDAQLSALAIPKTGQAVLLDIGEQEDIHPIRKKEAGERLAWMALKNQYGKDFPVSGPLYKAMEIRDGQIRVTFREGGGLAAAPVPETFVVRLSAGQTAPLVRNSPGSELEGFSICGKDRQWKWAQARIDGESVVVWSDEVPEPVAVRYAWEDFPTANLFGKNGLPASPFRTDDFPLATRNAKY